MLQPVMPPIDNFFRSLLMYIVQWRMMIFLRPFLSVLSVFPRSLCTQRRTQYFAPRESGGGKSIRSEGQITKFVVIYHVESYRANVFPLLPRHHKQILGTRRRKNSRRRLARSALPRSDTLCNNFQRLWREGNRKVLGIMNCSRAAFDVIVDWRERSQEQQQKVPP